MAINITESCLLIYGTATGSSTWKNLKLVPGSSSVQVWTNHHREYIKQVEGKNNSGSKAVATHGLFVLFLPGSGSVSCNKSCCFSSSSASNGHPAVQLVTAWQVGECFQHNNNNSSNTLGTRKVMGRPARADSDTSNDLFHLIVFPFVFSFFPLLISMRCSSNQNLVSAILVKGRAR